MDDVKALKAAIRKANLQPFADGWEQPDSEQVRAILKLAGLTGGEAAKLVGLSDGRTVRRWTGGDSLIPYAAWAILCDKAGYGKIWE